MKRLVLIPLVIVCAVAARSAHAAPSSAFACYSVWQTDPGAWSVDDSTVFSTWDSYGMGYWAPFAEKSVPTAEKVGSYYLTCAFPAGWSVTGSFVLGNGSDVTNDAVYFVDAKAIPGVYPVIAPG